MHRAAYDNLAAYCIYQYREELELSCVMTNNIGTTGMFDYALTLYLRPWTLSCRTS